jgi:RpiB/LacA/LacB family sugar-phosphate isomerase
MKVSIGGDHAGFTLKSSLREFLTLAGHEVLDVGAFSAEPSDYPDFSCAVAASILEGRAERGILVCGSGVGASVAANKIPGIRAAVCHDCFSAHQGVEDDDMNVLCLGERIIGVSLAREVVRTFLQARFSEAARHVRRLAKVKDIEEYYMKC